MLNIVICLFFYEEYFVFVDFGFCVQCGLCC